MVGAEGTMQYCSDTKVDLEGLDSLAVHEIVQAPAMAEMSREGFVGGWQERKHVSTYTACMNTQTNCMQLRICREAKGIHQEHESRATWQSRAIRAYL
jgi:hypothetical protein